MSKLGVVVWWEGLAVFFPLIFAACNLAELQRRGLTLADIERVAKPALNHQETEGLFELVDEDADGRWAGVRGLQFPTPLSP